MGLIKTHLRKESAKEKKDIHLINKLTKVKERGSITFDEWKESGRFTNREAFEQDNPSENLHIDCTDVVVYYGGLFIQVLKSGDFYLMPEHTSTSLDAVEKILWKKNAESLWG
jgi:hypothetical protein